MEGAIIPQLKSHAFGYLTLTENKKKKNTYVIITGGITCEHEDKCFNKEKCDCSNIVLNDQVYIYYKEEFTPIILEDKLGFQPLVRRYGHSMVTLANGKIYMLCGFIQYVGYVIGLIEMSFSINNYIVTCSCRQIDIPPKVKGRIYASVSVVFNKIVIFGGSRDTRTLNDMWVIDLVDDKTPLIQQVVIDRNIYMPRFGMSTSVVNDSHDNNLVRIIVLGGSYFNDENFGDGITSELLIFGVSVI